MTTHQNTALASLVRAGLHPGHPDINLAQPIIPPTPLMPATASWMEPMGPDDSVRAMQEKSVYGTSRGRWLRLRAERRGL